MGKEEKSVLWKSLSLLHKMDKKYIPMQIICQFLATSQTFLAIILGSRILDMVIEKEDFHDIMKVVMIMLFSSALFILIRWGLENILRVSEKVIDSRADQCICDQSLRLDYEILEKKETLDLVKKARDAYSSGGGIYSFCNKFAAVIESVISGITAMIILAFLFVLVPGKTTVLGHYLNQWYSGIVVLAALIASSWIRYRGAKNNAQKEQEMFCDSISFNRKFFCFYEFMEKYQWGKDIRLYHMQDYIVEEMEKNAKKLEKRGNKAVKIRGELCLRQSVAGFILSFISYLYVGLKGMLGIVGIGKVVCYVSAINKLSSAINNLLENYVDMKVRAKYISYYYDFLNIKNRKYEGTLPIEKRNDNKYQLEFRNVSFHYPNQEEMAIKNVSLKFTIGEKMAIVGPNGAGKSTFIKLLCRLYDPTEGEILLNGINIQLYDYEEYMHIFSVVFQDYQLFSFSLAENVATSPHYQDDKIEKCLSQAGFSERLSTLNEGIRTNIYQMKENGVEISGGEAQKVALARALYKDAPIVILDEPTAALDPISEYDIYKHFDEIVTDKTAVYISHRMSSCRFCQRIVVFEDGSIVQDGNHETLIEEKGGLYEKLWNAQAKYYQ